MRFLSTLDEIAGRPWRVTARRSVKVTRPIGSVSLSKAARGKPQSRNNRRQTLSGIIKLARRHNRLIRPSLSVTAGRQTFRLHFAKNQAERDGTS